jgi:Ca-activated chloride channel family protein
MKPAAPVLRGLVLLLVGCAALAQGPPPGNSLETDAFRISVEVDLVVLQATVRDHLGHTVMELGQNDFEVFEDGRAQPIRLFRHEDTPVTVGLIIDHSGSMRNKLADVTAGAQAFVRSSNRNDQMFVVNFNEIASLGLPIGMGFSDRVGTLGAAIWGAPAIGTTALYDAIVEGLKRLQQGSSDKKVLIVISDGGDNASKATLDRVLKLTEQSSAMIYTIGIFDADDPDKNPRVLQRLAHESGGEAFFPAEVSETLEICERIARDIRDQYTIGYSTMSGKKDGTYHKVRLTARAKTDGKLTVRTRAGYSSGVKLAPATEPAAK